MSIYNNFFPPLFSHHSPLASSSSTNPIPTRFMTQYFLRVLKPSHFLLSAAFGSMFSFLFMIGDDGDTLFKELQGIFYKFLTFLVAIITFKATDTGQHFFKTHPYLMVALVLAIMLYFSAWLIVTALHQLQIMRTFLPFMTCFVLTIGVIVSVWAFIIFI